MSKALRPHALYPHQRLIQRMARHIGRSVKYDAYKILPSHQTAAEVRNFLGEDRFEEFFSFAFVRNPWDRVVSLRSFTRLRPASKLHDLAVNGTLDDFVNALAETGTDQQIDYITGADGKIIVDKVARFETLAQDFNEICSQLSIQTRLTHKNKSRSDDYRTQYSDAGRDLVAELFARDIELLGYTFE